jgi:adenine phosphoribosyltransferase
LGDAAGLKKTIDDFADRYRNRDIDIVAGVEARGFILGSAIAYNLGLGFVRCAKKASCPAKPNLAV